MKYHSLITTVIIILLSQIVAYPNFLAAQSQRVAAVGDTAPNFSLVDFQGKKFTFDKKKNDKVRVFWFTNLCSGCQSVILDMEKIKSWYEKKNVEVVAVSQLGEDRATVERIIKEKKLTIRFLYDPKGEATSLYSGRYIPGTCPLKSLYIVQRNGTIQYANHFPGAPGIEIVKQIDKALAEKKN